MLRETLSMRGSARCRGTDDPRAPAPCARSTSSRTKAMRRGPAWRLRRGAGSRFNSGRNYRIGRAAKKRQLTVGDKARKREADMRDCARQLAATSAATRRRRRGQSPTWLKHLVKKCIRYSIGRLRGFGPRGKTLSRAATSSSPSTRSPAAAFSAACSGVEAFGIANT